MPSWYRTWLTLALVLGTQQATVLCQEALPPVSPLELARGLRDAGLPHLALNYLKERGPSFSANDQALLQLEEAMCRLRLAENETDESEKESLVLAATQQLNSFLRTQAKHPRVAEARVSLAQLKTQAGKLAVARARRNPDRAGAKADAIKAHRYFIEAAQGYDSAINGLQTLVNAEVLDSPRERSLQRQLLQAKFDAAINLFSHAEAYIDPNQAQREQRTSLVNSCRTELSNIANYSDEQELCWMAKAYLVELQLFNDNVQRKTYQDAAKQFINENSRSNAPVAAAAGVRMMRFFLLREDFVSIVESRDRAIFRNNARRWLNDYAEGQPNQESMALRYYLGTVLLNEALKPENVITERDQPTEPGGEAPLVVKAVRDTGLALLREADEEFRIVVSTDNDNTERAQRQRARVTRWLIGDIHQPATNFTSFEQCYLAALMHLEQTRPQPDQPAPPTAEQQLESRQRAQELLERGRTLPVPPEASRSAEQAKLLLAQVYNELGQYYQAATLAESLSRTARKPALQSRAGAVALFAYDGIVRRLPAQDPARITDTARMMALAEYVIQTAPNDPNTDDIRIRLGALYSDAGRIRDGASAFARVSPNASRVLLARRFQAIAAYELLRPLQPNEPQRPDALPENERQAFFNQTVAALNAVPKITASLPVAEAEHYFSMKFYLAQIHLTNQPTGYATAEAIAKQLTAELDIVPDYDSTEKEKLKLQASLLRQRALYGQAMVLVLKDQHEAALKLLDPVLKEVLAAGPAVKADMEPEVAVVAKILDEERVKLVMVPVLNARIRLGQLEQTASLMDDLKKFGGSVSATAAIVLRGVDGLRPTLTALRKEGKTAEADQMVATITETVNRLMTEPNLTVNDQLNLGRSLKGLGEFKKARELLEKIPAPSNAAYLPETPTLVIDEAATEEQRRAKLAEHDAQSSAAGYYRIAQLELLRIARETADFAKADAILEASLGQETELNRMKDRTGGWATRYFDFRREYYYLLVAKAQKSASFSEAVPYYNQAISNWRTWENRYKAQLDKLNLPMSRLKAELTSLLAKSEQGEDVGQEIARVQQQMGQIERDLNRVRPSWYDCLAERWRAQVTALSAQAAGDEAKQEASLGKIVASILEFEKFNSPLTAAVHQQLYDLFQDFPVLQKLYTGQEGTLLLQPPPRR